MFMNTTKKRSFQKILSWYFCLLLLALIVFSQYFFDITRDNKKLKQVDANILREPKTFSPAFLKIADFGFHQIVSDYLWLETIQYFGGGDFNKKYRALPNLLDTITELDPNFTYPYIFGMLVEPYQGDLYPAINLGEKGIKANPKTGMIAYYLASLYHLEQKSNFKRAAELYSLAAKDKSVPQAARVLAGVSLSQLDEKKAAIAWWQGILESYKKDSYEYERAQSWLGHILIEVKLEELAKTYKDRYGHYPENLDKLVEAKLVDEIPKSPLGVKYMIDGQSGKVDYKKH